MTRSERDIRKTAAELGLVILRVQQNRHVKYTMQRPDGSTFTLVTSGTPSGKYGPANQIRDLKRFALQGSGATLDPSVK